MRSRGTLVLACAFGVAVALMLSGSARAAAVGAVMISPSVVAVPANVAQKTSVLISAAVSGVAAGWTVTAR